MWGIFDETGIFVAICCHGFILIAVDMVKSGELYVHFVQVINEVDHNINCIARSKYPLAVAEYLIENLGADLSIGYDIGCGFKDTINNSKLSSLAKVMNFQSLIGIFHGHAHNCLCQLQNLGTYVKGLGLEDLEGCEWQFSRLNALARGYRYASQFHHHQSISSYFAHLDHYDTYSSLSNFLVNNHYQALAILNTQPMLLQMMDELGITSTNDFKCWLEEEQAYLTCLALEKELKEETVQLGYIWKLVKLQELK